MMRVDWSHLICRLLILPSISRCPAEYCSITSFTSYGRRVSLNFLLATRNFRILHSHETQKHVRMTQNVGRMTQKPPWHYRKDKTGILQTKANSCEMNHKINKCNKINYRKEPYQLHEWLMNSQRSSSPSSRLVIILTMTLVTERESVGIIYCVM